MAHPHLRIYFGPDNYAAASESPNPKAATGRVNVSLRDIFPVLSDAVGGERAWLSDFADDEVTISSDLYEILVTYQYFRSRPSA